MGYGCFAGEDGGDKKLTSHLPIIALCAMFVCVPLAISPILYRYVLLPKLLAFYVCGAILALSAWVSRRKSRDISWPLFVWGGVVCLSYFFRLDAGYPALHEAGFMISLVYFAVLVSLLSLDELHPVWWTATITGFAVALIGICQHWDRLAFIPQSAAPAATFGNRNLCAEYLICCIPVAVGLWWERRSRTLLVLAMAAMGVLLVLIGCRAAGLGLGFALFVILLRYVKRWYLLLALGVAVSLIFCIGVFFPSSPRKSASIQDRLTLWRGTVEMISDHPILGVGPAAWFREYPRYQPDAVYFQNPHNDYLWIAAEYGLVGLSAWLWMLAQTFRRLWRMSGMGRYLCASLAGLCVVALFGFPKESPATMMWMWTIIGVARCTPDSSSPFSSS